jgi:hypothetical protein
MALFPVQSDRVKIITKAATLSLMLANADIGTLNAEPISLPLHAKPISPPPGLVSWWPGDRNAKDIIGDNDGLLKEAHPSGTALSRKPPNLTASMISY